MVSGLTAQVLPLTRREVQELFIYDIAILSRYRRRGLGARLIEVALATAAASGIAAVFVAADNEDEHALEFYRVLLGESSAVTVFTFPAR